MHHLPIGENVILMKARKRARRRPVTGARRLRRQRPWLACLIPLVVITAPLAVAGAAPNPNGAAVVIGNRHYQEGIPEVLYAHRDAAAFREYLVGVRGFDPENIIELTDATQGEMTKTFGSASSHEGQLYYFLPDRLGGTSEVVVFYSGHGVPGTDGKAYLATADADLGTAHLTAYPLAQLYVNLGKLPAKSVTVYLDACFSGGSQGGALPTSASPVYRAAELPTGVADQMTVLAAASGKELASWDEQAEHGMFTHHLLNALYGAGDDNGDGEVTAREAKRYLDMHLTRAVGRAYMRPQTASLVGDAGAVLAFAPRGGFPQRPTLPGVGPRPQPFTVLTEPAGARVRILNIAERYRPGIELPPGEYRAEASAEGYETVVEVVRHGSAEATEHRIVLRQVVRRWTGGEVFRDCPDCPQMVVVPAGRFRMGCVSGQNCDDDEKPVHDVRIGSAFALSVYEVTFAEWDACVSDGGCGGYRPDDEGWGRGRRPAVNVSWTDALRYVSWLSRKTGEAYRLPSESEWEYAARAGSTTKYHFGNDESVLCRYGNHADADASTDYYLRNEACSDGIAKGTAPVGSYVPNAFGLHDMHGNVWEWTEDCWHASYAGAPADGSAWVSGNLGQRVLRGGFWGDAPRNLRAAIRNRFPISLRGNAIGFRVARTLTP